MPLLKHEEDVLDYHDKVWRIDAVLVNNFCWIHHYHHQQNKRFGRNKPKITL
jgi:hypothetical protein